MAASPHSKPSRKGPLWGLGISLYGTGGLIVKLFSGTPGEVVLALECLPVGLASIGACWWWLERRLAALEQWKRERLRTWIMSDLPPEQ